jgi:hypothetical protein
MNSNSRTDIAIVAACALVAAVAIAAPLTVTASPVRAVAAFGGVLVGPGALAYRLATGRRWGECFVIGTPMNVAAVMLIGLGLVDAHLWHPTAFELLIPLTTFVLCGVVLRRGMRRPSGTELPSQVR